MDTIIDFIKNLFCLSCLESQEQEYTTNASSVSMEEVVVVHDLHYNPKVVIHEPMIIREQD